MKISFHGAARTVTGSKHIIHTSKKNILLDCGMFQGMGNETFPLNEQLGFDSNDINYVILSHAHIDHIGLLPKLVKEGYKGPIICSEATFELAQILLKDSANIQKSDTAFANKLRSSTGKASLEPLYTQEDVLAVLPLMKGYKKREWIKIDEDIDLLYTEAGHILGAAVINLRIKDKGKLHRLVFSGDIGRYRDDILKAPEEFPQTDYIIMESTYGNTNHPLSLSTADQLLKQIHKTCIEQKGKLIIPAFSVGRTQELLYALNQLEQENRLPDIPYYVDSPMSVQVTEVTKMFPKLFNAHVQKVLEKDDDPFQFKKLKMITHVEDSKALNLRGEPCVIISASGMAEAGRIKHHIANNIEKSHNTILIVGYCEPMSLGGRLKSGAEKVGIFGQQFNVKAEVVVIESLSAHADYNDLSQWLSCQDPQQIKKIFLVHGEYEVQLEFKNRLIRKGFKDVVIPDLHETIGLG